MIDFFFRYESALNVFSNSVIMLFNNKLKSIYQASNDEAIIKQDATESRREVRVGA
jgi:hypothetical protein